MEFPRVLTESEIEVLRDLLAGRPQWLPLARALEREADTRRSHGLRMLSLAFVYDLIDPAHRDRRAVAGGPYATMIEDAEGTFPPRPADVLEDVRAVWRSTSAAVPDPIITARIGDILYVAEGKAAHEEGRAGAGALVRVARNESGWGPLERAVSMARALEVMAELNDRAGLSAAVPDAVALVDGLLGQEHPGPPFIVARALIALKPKQRPDDLDRLLDRVIERFTGESAEEGALALAASATNDGQRRQSLRRRHLELLIEGVTTAEALAKVSLLQRAIEFARRYGFDQEATTLLRQQQDLPKDSLGFETMETEVEVPTDAIRSEIDLFVGSQAADLLDALDRLGTFGPPGGSNSDIDNEVDEQTAAHPIAGLFTQQLFTGEASTPVFIANDAESKRLMGRGRQRQIHADFHGSVLIAPMIDAAAEHHGRPTHEDLTAHFATELIGPERAERIARSLQLFWDGHYDDAAHIIVPRLEGMLRDLARINGATIVKPAREGRFAGVIALNTVMAKLRELYADAPWSDYLEALLCDPLALNLRNNIAHGLAGRVGRSNAALLIQAACYMALFRDPPPKYTA